eukprot:CFRG3153T1
MKRVGPEFADLLIEVAVYGLVQVAVCYTLWKGWSALNGPETPSKPLLLPNFILKRLEDRNERLNEREMVIAAEIVNPDSLTVEWKDIGGLDEQIRDLQEVVILPFKYPDLFASGSKLRQPPHGILLYGKPGCGKTMLAKAMAKESHCAFINLNVATLTDKWYGETQKLVHGVFSLARKIQPTIVFIDEIDSLLSERRQADHEATAMLKTQFMSLWDGLGNDPSTKVIVIGATNRPEAIDKAILRRMPRTFHIDLPQQTAREAILRVMLKDERIDIDVDYLELGENTERFSGSALSELCRLAAMRPLREFLSDGIDSERDEGAMPRPISMADFTHARQHMTTLMFE